MPNFTNKRYLMPYDYCNDDQVQPQLEDYFHRGLASNLNYKACFHTFSSVSSHDNFNNAQI